MIPLYEITDEELSSYKSIRIAQDIGRPSYSELWLTSDENKVIKLFSTDETIRGMFSDDIENDVSTLFALSKASDCFEDRFVLPDIIFEQKSEIIGYSMPYIQGVSLSQQKYLPMAQFKQLVQRVYDDILFINNKAGFSLADLHEDNLILGDDGQWYHIDLDGWYCRNGKGRRSRYITFAKEKLIRLDTKYEFDINGNVIPNLNSDLFCLVQMILNYLIQKEFCFAEMTEGDQFRYLQYISDCCDGADIACMYNHLFSCEDNTIDMKAILSFPEDISSFSYDSFIKQTSKFKSPSAAEEFLRENELKLSRLVPDRIRLMP